MRVRRTLLLFRVYSSTVIIYANRRCNAQRDPIDRVLIIRRGGPRGAPNGNRFKNVPAAPGRLEGPSYCTRKGKR